jgi:hypothetical protein
VAVGVNLAINRVDQGRRRFWGAAVLLCSRVPDSPGPNPTQSASRGRAQASFGSARSPVLEQSTVVLFTESRTLSFYWLSLFLNCGPPSSPGLSGIHFSAAYRITSLLTCFSFWLADNPAQVADSPDPVFERIQNYFNHRVFGLLTGGQSELLPRIVRHSRRGQSALFVRIVRACDVSVVLPLFFECLGCFFPDRSTVLLGHLLRYPPTYWVVI